MSEYFIIIILRENEFVLNYSIHQEGKGCDNLYLRLSIVYQKAMNSGKVAFRDRDQVNGI